MTSLHVNKCADDFEKSFKESIHSLKNCHNILSEYAADDDGIGALLLDLASIGKSYKEELVDFHKFQSTINATEEHFNKDDNIEDSFESVFKNYLKTAEIDRSSVDTIVDQILEFTRDSSNKDDENSINESVICTQSSINLVDPITKQQIRVPFKSKICSHVYEKDSITAYIKKKKKLAKCPYVGCTNSDMRIGSLELDFSLSQRINEGAFTSTQIQAQQSITSLAESSDEEQLVGDDKNEDMDVDEY